MSAGEFADTDMTRDSVQRAVWRNAMACARAGNGTTDILEEIVERQILPRLITAGKAAGRSETGDAETVIGEDDIDILIRLLMEGAPDACCNFVHDVFHTGVSLQSIYLDLLAPAAQRLGPMWLDDDIDFVDVSMALARLQTLIFKVARCEAINPALPDPDRRILLARARGEQHAFGLMMVAEFFRLGGWQVYGGTDLESGDDLNRAVAERAYSVVGLTAGSRCKAMELADDIRALRKNSCNPDLKILVGGAAFCIDPELAREIGADFTASEGIDAVDRAEACLAG